MRFVVVTIFPEMFAPLWSQGIVGRAKQSGLISAECVNVREFARDRHRTTDDRPYGGGCGMVMKPEPLAAAIRAAAQAAPGAPRILLSPQGRGLDQRLAAELAAEEGLVLICGRYEGTDARIEETLVDFELSVGDYILTGGELPAMVVIDAVTRLLPGALGGETSAERETFAGGRLEHAHYTRPRVFEGRPVPEVLLSGHHGAIERWRLENALLRTLVKRPDLLAGRPLSAGERTVLDLWRRRLTALLEGPAGERPAGGDDLEG